MIKSLLIANRGEIACRIIRTARRMGIRTVAVYSDADAKALHVRQADEAVHIGPSPARESYLVGEKIIAAAKQTGAEAIHPGYGFLSENAEFAQSVTDAGLVWVGPKPASITAMGLKDAAKERMIAAGVPVTPGYLGEDQSPDRLKVEADAIGYPVLIKAVAGGGGKGMRRVDAGEDFADALLSCQREAASSFGDDRVLIEKYILSPRHIEVQVFGDTHGNVVHLFERDCSLQRRHQKVIEEAPAPGMDAETREAICAAAVKAAQAVDYVGAGTIEFIADASEGLRADRIWFMEMNTRLQVEHPVTEEITGQDLVEWQLRVASGEPLPKRQDELAINGWAMEARLYAEDPAKGFLPSTGVLEHFVVDRAEQAREFTQTLKERGILDSDTDWSLYDAPPRVETGVDQGAEISPFYDPMIAKLVTHGRDRNEAIDALIRLSEDVQVWPVKTNAAFLAHLLQRSEFKSGIVTTGFIADHLDDLLVSAEPDDHTLATAFNVLKAAGAVPQPHQWAYGAAPKGFRLNSAPIERAIIQFDGHAKSAPISPDNPWTDTNFTAQGFTRYGEGVIVYSKGQAHVVSLSTRPSSAGSVGDGAILSPMPGRVIAVEVSAGQAVTKGQKLLTLEAMKMEHSLTAPFDGTVAELNAETGGQVSEGALLVKIEKAD